MSDGYRFPVDATSILQFASALAEENRIYYDREYAEKTPLGGVIAPPTFTTVSAFWNADYPLRGVRRIPAVAPKTDSSESRALGGGNTARVLHAEQRFEYHKPLRPGMELRVTSRPGKTWEKAGRKGGVLKFRETVTEFRDEKGELVVTATGVGVVTEKAVEE